MAIEIIKTNGNVILVEPNSININTNMIAGIPEYENMYIFAELIAESKGRTVIIGGNTSSDSSGPINFIGNNQNEKDNPNYLNFTTNYYDGSNTGNENGKYYEGFGISSIKIVINSSFIPQVNIQFIDIRGLAFFNQTDSPYRMLFNFPPPIFTLTVKGYYGKPITYRLHLVKYTSDFNSDNGNFIIDAHFVAVTFAPLTDILFRYIVNAPLINNKESMKPTTGEPPKSTFELILKLKNVYKAINRKLDTDSDNKLLTSIRSDVKKINEIYNTLNNYKNNEILTEPGEQYLVIKAPIKYDNILIYPKTNSIPDENLTVINNLSEYNTVLKNEQLSGKKINPKNKLFIVYVAGENIPVGNNEKYPLLPYDQEVITPIYFEYETENYNNFEKALKTYKKQLINDLPYTLSIDDNDITDPEPFLIVGTNSSLATKYYGMDITQFYQEIYLKKIELENNIEMLSLKLVRKINAMVDERLGMMPSIYNIFNVILNDVDIFFKKLKKVSQDAYDSHNNVPENKKIIIGDTAFVENKTIVYSFPLIVNKLGNNREERVAPIKLSQKTDIEFPEITFCTDFIKTFLDQRNYAKNVSIRDELDDSGNYKWISISPLDSILGGASPESPYLGISDNVKNETLTIMLERFYILTQGILPDAIYIPPVGNKKMDKENIIISNAYVKLYAESEAINLVTALTSEIACMNLGVMGNQYTTNTKLDEFYKDIEKLSFTYDDGTISKKPGNLYDFPTNDPKYFSITPTSEGSVYVDKNNKNFNGLELIDGGIELQEFKNTSQNPINKFPEETVNKGLFKEDPAEHFFAFTKDNLLYIKDETTYPNTIINYVSMRTRYIQSISFYKPNFRYNDNNYPGENKDSEADRQELAYNQGNAAFTYRTKTRNEKAILNNSRNIIDHWANVLGYYDTELIDILTGTSTYNKRISSMLILSNFGFTASPFNTYSNGLNNIVFSTPAAIEVPRFYSPYIGCLLHAINNNWVEDIKDFFITGAGSKLDNRGFLVLADLHDIKNYLSDNDKTKFLVAYNEFININKYHDIIVSGIEKTYRAVDYNKSVNLGNLNYFPTPKQTREELYVYFLNPQAPNRKEYKEIKFYEKGEFYIQVIKFLIERVNILNYSQITFKYPTPTTIGYTSLKELNKNGIGTLSSGDTTTINNNYFKTFFTKLNSLIGEKGNKLKEEAKELKKSKGDEDIINQLYYSFKNINDKWLTGNGKDKAYPFIGDKNLIDLFAFIDRGMNPIGETIINCEILTEMLEDPNISLFTVLSQLLSLNGFEFFPLQNFMSFKTQDSWKDSFKIYDGAIDDTENTFFVCMYVGGASSYPSVSGNGFENDGIIDITEPGVSGFNIDDSGDKYEENINQLKNLKEFPWRQVRAFRVRFGEQNQSMFKDMKIDSKEYPETNESIQILSRLAGDNSPDAPVPKGQNLYNLYENRSYKATVTGFGNAMIQPTQYFQLENVPLFNGAYIILNVEHNITPNKMTTSFSGTKLLKYPVPRVLTPVAFTEFGSQSAGDIAANARRLATYAKNMTPKRVKDSKAKGGLDSVFGVDVSHHNGNANWKLAKRDGVEFAFIKFTEGNNFFSGNQKPYDINKQINDAIDNKILVGYYHFANWGNTSNPIVDGVTQANNFISRLNALTPKQKSKFPAVLDVEGGKAWITPYKWSNKTTDLSKCIQSFIDTMTDAGYKTMIYSGNYFLKDHQITGFGQQTLWLPLYYDLRGKYNPEKDEPSAPNDWFDWDIWQFSAQGIVDGIPPALCNGKEGVDLNVMRKRFLKQYT